MSGDNQVEISQRWLNKTYGGVAGWVTVTEDGLTGWPTMYALRRALQIELGLTSLGSGFGPATTAAFIEKIGRIDATTPSTNILQILSAAFWCKGYWGLFQGEKVLFSNLTGADSLGGIKKDLGLNEADEFVDVKLMRSLTTMDAYTRVRSGLDWVREVQQWFNANYSNRADFELVPCDGIYSRQVQTALMFSLQYEMGFADGAATGNFGPGTRAGLTSKAPVGPGSVDTINRFVHIYQAALRFNGYDSPFSGTFDTVTLDRTLEFQAFMELSASGRGDYGTWCSLLVSSGDTSIATKGFDTNVQLTAAEAKGAVSMGYTTVGRYTVGSTKFITSTELDGLRAAGLKLFPIHQRFNNEASVMTEANGHLHGIEAVERCRTLGLPDGSIIYFSVDFDADGETISGPVADYFRGVKSAMQTSIMTKYEVGIYGTRNACSQIVGLGYAKSAFVAGMSTGYSGNMGFPMPGSWKFNQILEISVTFPGSTRTFKIDKDVVSTKSDGAPVDLTNVVSPPVEQDGSTSATGFDAFFAWLVRAEVACERGLDAASNLTTPLKSFAASTPSFVAHWLQKPKYWDNNELWPLYTPVIDTGQYAKLARSAAEDELAKLDTPKPDSNRDIAHFAATLRGYQVWGVPTEQDKYGLGDLGGWALDLLSLWGSYLKVEAANPGTNLLNYCTSQLGLRGSTTGFDWDDLVADADGYLVAAAVRDGAESLSQALRILLKQSSAQRVGTFYRRRFGASETNVANAFAKLTDGLDVGIDNLPLSKEALLRAAGGASRLPSTDEALTCGRAYALKMSSIG
jgi:peptidoglycan hydrolase-like protein with peptidoglycan-binding domain